MARSVAAGIIYRGLGDSEMLNRAIGRLSMEMFKKAKLTGTRRFGRLVPRVEVSEAPRGIRLSFVLHKGGYATSLLREFMKA